jgi:hypothetical protein
MKELVEKWYIVNDGSRTLLESIIAPEVQNTTERWIAKSKSDFVVIGGIALAYHHIPRYTQDLDVLYLRRETVPTEVDGFKRTRDGAYEDRKTGVEVELVTSGFVNIPQEIVDKVFDTAIHANGIKIASKSGLVALKLVAIPNRPTKAKALQDKVDIMHILEIGGVDVSDFPLPQEALERLEQIKREMQ